MSSRSLKVLGGALGAGLVVLVAWYLLLWGPQGGRIEDAQAERDAATARNQQLLTQVERLQGAKERQPELVAQNDRLKAAIPDQPDLAAFILSADDAASTSGVTFMAITPQAPATAEDATLPTVVAVSIEAEGGYFQVLDFVNRLEDLDRLVVIDSIDVAPQDDSGLALTVALQGRIFTTAEPAPADATGLASTTTTTTTTVAADGSTATTTSTEGGTP